MERGGGGANRNILITGAMKVGKGVGYKKIRNKMSESPTMKEEKEEEEEEEKGAKKTQHTNRTSNPQSYPVVWLTVGAPQMTWQPIPSIPQNRTQRN